MKPYKTILNEIKKNRETIEAKTAEISKLEYSEERHQAANNGGMFNNATYTEYLNKAHANAGQVAKLCEDIYISEIKERILKANARAALINEALPIILTACEKYNGKSYGEKTREKIHQEVKKAGYSFYFKGYQDSQIIIYTLNKEGYKNYACDEATATAIDEAGHITRFITEDNKLNINNVIIKSYSDEYTDNPTKEAKKIAKAIQSYSKATKELEAQRVKLRNMLPAGIKEPEYINEYYIRF